MNQESYAAPVHAAFRSFLLFLLLPAVAGCAAPNYSEALKKFSAATADTQTALTRLNETAMQEYEAHLKSRILATTGSNLERVDGECKTTGGRCRLEILSADSEANGKRLPPVPILDDLVELMSHVSAYARGLEALVDDQSATEVQASVNAAMGNIQNLATTLTRLGEDKSTNVPTFAAPVSSAVYWIVGKYADNVKIRGLGHATAQADPIIQDAARYFSSAGDLAARVKATRLSEALNAELKVLSEKGLTEPRIDRAVAAAKRFDDFLRADPSAVFQRLASTHQSLERLLNERDVSLAQLFADIDNFSKSAEELAKIVNELAALGSR